MARNEEYLKKFKQLVEFKIQDTYNSSLNNLAPITEEEEEVEDVKVEEEPIEFEDTEAVKQSLPEDELEKLTKEDDLTRVKEIQDQQTEELNRLTSFVDEITKNIEDLKQKTIDIEAMKKNIEIVNTKVKEITPATPEEQLEKMAAISGGMSIKDVWNNYLLNTSIKQAVDEPTEGEEVQKYSEPITNIKNFNDIEVKDSFYK